MMVEAFRWWISRRVVVAVSLVWWLLLAGCSASQDAEVVWEGEEGIDITGRLVADGGSVWWLDSPDEGDVGVSLVRVDAGSGDVTWSRQAGFYNVGSLVFHDGFLWYQIASLTRRSSLPDEYQLLKVDAGTGDVVGQVSVESSGQRGLMVDDVLWTAQDRAREVVLVDTGSVEVVDSWEFRDLQGPDGEPDNPPEDLVLLDGVVWIIDGENVAGFDAESRELVGFIELGQVISTIDGDGFDQIETHDGVLWAGNIEPDRSTEYEALRIDPKTEEFEAVDFFESPLGSVEYEGFVFDVVGPEKVEQIDAETGETVASFENLNPFSFVVVDDYLWAHDNEKVFRYPVAGS